MENLSFGEALVCAKCGHKISRSGWNGKDMWVSYTQGKILDLKFNDIWTQNIKDVANENGGKVEILPYLIMKTVDNKIVMGWLASQTDMLSNDWFVVKKPKLIDEETLKKINEKIEILKSWQEKEVDNIKSNKEKK